VVAPGEAFHRVAEALKSARAERKGRLALKRGLRCRLVELLMDLRARLPRFILWTAECRSRGWFEAARWRSPESPLEANKNGSDLAALHYEGSSIRVLRHSGRTARLSRWCAEVFSCRITGPLRNAPGASLPPVSTSGNPTLCEIQAPRSVDQTNDLGLPQMPRGRGLNLCAR
jgi:hypothetical protein